MLMAPLVAIFGERSDMLLRMRLPMLVFFGIVLWAAYAIARQICTERVAMWAVVLLALFPRPRSGADTHRSIIATRDF